LEMSGISMKLAKCRQINTRDSLVYKQIDHWSWRNFFKETLKVA
jgi:hypothetical protein